MNYLQTEKIERFLSFKRAVLALIILGIILRLVSYLNLFPMWGDEASLMYSIFTRSYIDLLKPLDFIQVAPPLLLFFERMMIDLFGRSELAVRFLFFISGCGILFLFYRLCKQIDLSKTATIIALTIVVFSPLYQFYSVYIKQYGTDVFFFLLIFTVYTPWVEVKLTLKRVIIWSLVGIISVSFSHPAAFVIFVVGIAIMVRYISLKKYSELFRFFIVLAFIFLTFVLIYYFTVVLNKNIATQVVMYQTSFPHFKKGVIHFIKWFYGCYAEVWYRAVGINETGAFTILGLIAFGAMFRENKKQILYLLAPIAVAFIVSFFPVYPVFPGKFLFFASPAVIILLGYGIDVATRQLRPGIIIPSLISLYFLVPMVNKVSYKNKYDDDIRLPMQYLAKNANPSDTIYVFTGAFRTYEYYKPKYLSNYNNVFYGTRPWKPDIEKIAKHKKIWLIFSYLNDDYLIGGDRKGMLEMLKEKNGKILKEEIHNQASAHLIEFEHNK